jgi:HEAT repeat protein
VALAAQKGELVVLLRGFTSDEECVVRASAYGLIAAARHSRVEAITGIVDHLESSTKKKLQATVPAYTVFALGEIGSREAVEPLSKLLIHVKDISVKRAMIEALGNLPPGAESFIVPALLKLSAERDDQIRFQAVLSLAKAAGALSPALHPDLVSPVVRVLANFVTLDNNRYVQVYALEGLKRLRTCPEAQDLLIRILMSQRWCPITTKASAF